LGDFQDDVIGGESLQIGAEVMRSPREIGTLCGGIDFGTRSAGCTSDGEAEDRDEIHDLCRSGESRHGSASKGSISLVESRLFDGGGGLGSIDESDLVIDTVGIQRFGFDGRGDFASGGATRCATGCTTCRSSSDSGGATRCATRCATSRAGGTSRTS